MLSSISWSQFITAITLILMSYYLIVAGLYYRIEIFRLFRAKSYKQNPVDQENQMTTLSTGNNEITRANEKVQLLMRELNKLLTAALKTKTVKEELVMALQMLLRDYSDLKDQAIVSEINQHIKIECKNICSITLSDVEMKMLWNG